MIQQTNNGEEELYEQPLHAGALCVNKNVATMSILEIAWPLIVGRC